jgi:Arc/MetJ-type ribon-helix-helix transcriptional regulator
MKDMTQLVARIPDDVAAELDELVSSGAFESRSQAVREALVQLIDRRRREELGRQIVAGYRRIPQTDHEAGWADAATREMIEEEPW